MNIEILMLGPARDVAGVGQVTVEVPNGSTVAALRVALVQAAPGLERALPTMRLAINDEFVDDDTVVHADNEVALIPPVSGGSNESSILVEIVSSPIVREEVIAFVSGDVNCGAIATFTGTTRIEHDAEHGPLIRLEYEAYNDMAETQMRSLATQAIERWSLTKVALVHRIGPVPPGDASIVIAVSSGHRAEAFDACRWLIDTLKQDVPIWKKDVFQDGYVRWVAPKA